MILHGEDEMIFPRDGTAISVRVIKLKTALLGFGSYLSSPLQGTPIVTTHIRFIPQADLGSIFESQLSSAFAAKTRRLRLSEIRSFVLSLTRLKVIPAGDLKIIGTAMNAAGELGVVIVIHDPTETRQQEA